MGEVLRNRAGTIRPEMIRPDVLTTCTDRTVTSPDKKLIIYEIVEICT